MNNLLSPSLNKRLLFWVILFSWSLIYLFIVFTNHYLYKSFGFDYGLFNQMYWKYAHLRMDNTYDRILTNSLQDHFSLTMFFLTPFYWLLGWWFTKSYTLLIIEVAFIVIGAYGTFKWVAFKTKNEWLSLAAMFHFFTIQGVLSVFTNDYHDIVIGSCLIPFFLYFIDSKQLGNSILTLVFIITCKENMPLIMAFSLLVFLIADWKDGVKRRNTLILFLISGLYAVALFAWLMPLVDLKAEKSWVFKYYHLGNSIHEVVINLITHPKTAFCQLFINHTTDRGFDWVKVEFYVALFLFWGGFLLFLKPKYLLVIIPLILQKVYSDIAVMWGIYSYYSIEICCFLVGMVYVSLGTLADKKYFKPLVLIVLLLNIAFTINYLTGGTKVNWMANNEKVKFFDAKFYKDKKDIQFYNQISHIIPDTASLCCTQKLSTHLSGRDKISIFPNVRDYNYIAIDTLDSYPLSVQHINDTKHKLINSGEWDTLYSENRFLILKRKE